ncbi:MAG: hypothetical protein ACREM8_00125 [Vulcanimicrobiaceae bacterium]
MAILGAASVLALGGDLWASFPRGDGGLFLQICRQITAGHFAYPRAIDFNGFQIPFSYSPLAFYCVALAARVLAMAIPHAMNLWVVGWDFAIAPAAYWASFRILRNRDLALAAAAFVIVCPGNLPWLGMGGGITRAPGFVCYLIACGTAWDALRDGAGRTIVLASVFGALTAWFHMEFAMLYAISCVTFVAFMRPSPRRVLALIVGTTLLTLPWLLLLHLNLAPFGQAAQTSHSSMGYSPLPWILWFYGLPPGQNVVGLMGTLALIWLLLERRYDWLIWSFVLVFLDSRAGPQAAHLPLGLAVGWGFGRLRDSLRVPHAKAWVAFLGVIAFGVALSSASAESRAYRRLDRGDIADMGWIGTHTERNALVVTAAPKATTPVLDDDQSYEWLPAIAQRRSPTTYEGLEWVGSRTYARFQSNYYFVQGRCPNVGIKCVERFMRRSLDPASPAYLFVPRGDAGGTFATALIATDRRFALVHADSGGAVFRFLRKTASNESKGAVSRRRISAR